MVETNWKLLIQLIELAVLECEPRPIGVDKYLDSLS